MPLGEFREVRHVSETCLVLNRAGDPVVIPVNHPETATSLTRSTYVRAWAAPGCVMVQAWSGLPPPGRGEAEPDRTHLACVR